MTFPKSEFKVYLPLCRCWARIFWHFLRLKKFDRFQWTSAQDLNCSFRRLNPWLCLFFHINPSCWNPVESSKLLPHSPGAYPLPRRHVLYLWIKLIWVGHDFPLFSVSLLCHPDRLIWILIWKSMTGSGIRTSTWIRLSLGCWPKWWLSGFTFSRTWPFSPSKGASVISSRHLHTPWLHCTIFPVSFCQNQTKPFSPSQETQPLWQEVF